MAIFKNDLGLIQKAEVTHTHPSVLTLSGSPRLPLARGGRLSCGSTDPGTGVCRALSLWSLFVLLTCVSCLARRSMMMRSSWKTRPPPAPSTGPHRTRPTPDRPSVKRLNCNSAGGVWREHPRLRAQGPGAAQPCPSQRDSLAAAESPSPGTRRPG